MKLQIVSGLFYGGGQQVALDLVRALRRSSGGLSCLCILGNRSPVMASHADYVVPFDGSYNRLRCLVATGNRLRRLLRRVDAVAVHTHGWDASIIGALAVHRSHIAQLVHWHTTDSWLTSRSLTHRIRRWLTRRLLSGRGKQVVAVSDASRKHLCKNLGWPLGQVQVIRNGIDADRFRPDKAPDNDRRGSGAVVIGTAARLAAGKGIEYLLQAVALVRAQTSCDLRVRIAGEGGHRRVLEAEMRRLELDTCVEFLGQVHDTAAFYRTLDVFALPSLSEGLPLSVLEAMASECAVVATDVGGVTEALRDGVDGLVVRARDVEGLAAALAHLAANESIRESMGCNGRARILSGFTLDAMAGQVATTVDDLVARSVCGVKGRSA